MNAEGKTEAILGEDTIYFSPEEQIQQAIRLITWTNSIG